LAFPETVLSVFTDILPYLASPALPLAVGSLYSRVSRARLLDRAGNIALEKGSTNRQRKAALKIIEALTSDQPWYRAILPGRRSGDS
jgi:hypothetical protein